MSDYNCWSGVIKDIDDLKAEIQQLKEENKLLRDCIKGIRECRIDNAAGNLISTTMAKIKGDV